MISCQDCFESSPLNKKTVIISPGNCEKCKDKWFILRLILVESYKELAVLSSC